MKPGEAITSAMTPVLADLWHGATGVATECGELAEACVLTLGGGQIDRENLNEELGDLEFYIEALRQNIGVTRNDIHLIFSLDDLYASPFNLAVGCSTPVLFLAINAVGGIILDFAKKAAIYNKPLDRDGLMKNLFFLDHLIDATMERYGLCRANVLQANIAKLSVRYAGHTYTDAAAQARADKVETV